MEGKKKRKRSLGFSPIVAAIDTEGIIREAHLPQEIKGMELVELTKETDEEYLSQTGKSLNSIHLKYIQNRLSKLPDAPKEGMWYHIKRDKGLT